MQDIAQTWPHMKQISNNFSFLECTHFPYKAHHGIAPLLLASILSSSSSFIRFPEASFFSFFFFWKMSVELPEECWELVFRFLGHHRHFESLSLVCKQFHSITNRLQFSLTIAEPTIPFLPQLLFRFRRLKFIDLSHFHGDLDGILHQISRSGLALDSLNLSNQKSLPANGLRELGSKIKSLRVLSCSKMGFLHDSDLILIADCFPFLEELDISFPENSLHKSFIALNYLKNSAGPVSDSGIMALALALKKLRRCNLSGNYFITDKSLLSLCENCELLKEIVLFDCDFITQMGIASAIRQRPYLDSISISINGIGRNSTRANIHSDLIGSFMSLKSLTAIDLSNSCVSDELLFSVAEEGFPLKKIIFRGCYNYTFAGIYYLLSKCQSVEYLDLQKADFLSDQNVKELSVLLHNVTLINLGGSLKLTNSTFFTLTRNCPLLNEIKMEETFLGEKVVENSSMDFIVNSQVKCLHLAKNRRLGDHGIKEIASICPNLELLDLSSCWGISEEGVVEVLKKCCKIRHLNLAFCAGLTLFEIEFEVSKLEVLDLSESRIGDEALSVISKRCRGLLHLNLQNCFNVTAKGVKVVVENCRGLRQINLKRCNKVAADIVAWMVFSRPTLRKIIAPPSFGPSESQRKFFLRHGCIVC